MGSQKRILVVDDETRVLFVLSKSLKKLDESLVIDTASSGSEALARLKSEPYELVITDLRMPGMDGLELMGEIRSRHPQVRLILMTAYGSPEIEATAYRLGACRYIDKPFQIEDLYDRVQMALAQARLPGKNVLVLSDETSDKISRSLTDLRFEVGAQCILLADLAGELVASVGDVTGLDPQTVISLIGGGFATAFELGRYLQERQTLTLNYHEGERYDIYSSNVNHDLFVVLFFGKAQGQSRIGMVWLYVRRALKELRDLLAGSGGETAGRGLGDNFGSLLSESMDRFFVAGDS